MLCITNVTFLGIYYISRTRQVILKENGELYGSIKPKEITNLMKIVYIVVIFDLFHRGHLESLKQAKNIFEDCFLLVGVISDEVAKSYKREPIINEDDRIEIIRSLDIVDKVIENPPLIITFL